MNKLFIGIIFYFIILIGCTTSPPVTQTTSETTTTISTDGLTLDQAIAEAAIRIDERIIAGTKIAPLNFNSPSDRFSTYVLDELTANLVDSGKLIVVDRSEIDLIRSEFDFQYSGEVGDDSMQALGRILGAQSIISGSLTDMGGFYRIVIRVLNVQNASVEVQYRANIARDPIVNALLSGGRTTTTNSGQIPQTAQPTITGILVPGGNITEKLAWLQRSADSHNTYIIEVQANENIAPHTFDYRGAVNITIVLRGDTVNRIIRLRSNGTMFTIRQNVTLVLDNNITLQGHNGNNGSIVNVNGGIFIMKTGSAITGNINIRNRNDNTWGGGVLVNQNSTFIMDGGIISDNVALYGGGVLIDRGTFIMNSGTITGNIARESGGGINIHDPNGGIFNMVGGTITGNTARTYGGGVILGPSGVFSKTGGTITGYNSDSNNGNVVRNEAGNVLSRRGHAVFAYINSLNHFFRKETTIGSDVNISFTNGRAAGNWDN